MSMKSVAVSVASIVFALLASRVHGLPVADDDPVSIAAKLVEERTNAAADRLAEKEVEQRGELERIRNGRIEPKAKKAVNLPGGTAPKVYPSKKAKESAVSEAEAALAATQSKLARYRNGAEYVYGSLTYPTKVGDYGTIYRGDSKVKVAQVIDGSTMIITVYYEPSEARVPGRRVNATALSMKVKGVSTHGATDDAGFELPMIFRVSGTETIATVGGGSRTMFVLEPIDKKAVEAYLASKKSSP